MTISTDIIHWIDANQQRFIALSDKIWEFAEIRFEEVKSAKLQIEVLEEEGFEVTKGVADMPTAFVASYGKEGPIIAVLGEYDALSGLSQKAGVFVKTPVEEGASGHGCGHNLLGAGSLAAAIAVKNYIKSHKIPGIIQYYGCPGEEGGSGKTYMVREGLFDDVDIALCWHPFSTNFIFNLSSLSNIQVYFRFKGISAHAAAAPHMGRSALDAVELMNIGANYLREHIITQARLHYAVTNTGGNAPNVVQADAEVLYLIRAPTMLQTKEIYERVKKIAKGAALMTETEVEIIFDKAASNLIPNDVVGDVLFEKFKEVGAPQYTEEEIEFGKKLRQTFNKGELPELNRYSVFRKELGEDIIEKIRTKIIFDDIFPNTLPEFTLPGSTDVGDVSWVVPTSQIGTSCVILGTPGHSWQEVTQCTTSISHKGMIAAAKVMALTALDFMENTERIDEAKAELKKRLGSTKYESPITSEIKPNVPEWVFDAMK
ncbi:MAG: p-aminobenzoyl-glutamate hydrolase subunit B [Candidatus Heimdallarchaeota archaeon AB_125]|nr:MAG: p-aminobenzoyl-glutamate hydrolase subunit B [Candidatus Heimdallarchaeota archaeon AB_125]